MPKTVEVYDFPSNMGGSHTVSIIEKLDNNRVKCRIWYGHATWQGWQSWADFSGFEIECNQAELTNKRTMQLTKIGKENQ
tara:strand:+ start:1062 stop:1301 length:240 start_codon:yes stop_codon:yes gene_type:complete